MMLCTWIALQGLKMEIAEKENNMRLDNANESKLKTWASESLDERDRHMAKKPAPEMTDAEKLKDLELDLRLYKSKYKLADKHLQEAYSENRACWKDRDEQSKVEQELKMELAKANEELDHSRDELKRINDSVFRLVMSKADLEGQLTRAKWGMEQSNKLLNEAMEDAANSRRLLDVEIELNQQLDYSLKEERKESADRRAFVEHQDAVIIGLEHRLNRLFDLMGVTDCDEAKKWILAAHRNAPLHRDALFQSQTTTINSLLDKLDQIKELANG